MDALVTSLTTGFTSMASSALSAIGSIVPVMLPITGGIMVIGIVIRVVKQLGQ